MAWRALLTQFTVGGTHPGDDEALAALLVDLAPAAASEIAITVNVARVPSVPLGSALAGVISTVNLHAIDSAVGNLLLHGAAVADATGGVTVACGQSGSGKSTLVVELVAAGFRYVTDETVCLHPQTMNITPYQKPISIKRGAQARLEYLRPPALLTAGSKTGTWFVPASTIGAVVRDDELLLPELLVFPEYVHGAPLEVERLSEAEAAYRAGANTSRLAELGPLALSALRRLAQRAPAFKIVHGDARAAAEVVRDLWEATR